MPSVDEIARWIRDNCQPQKHWHGYQLPPAALMNRLRGMVAWILQGYGLTELPPEADLWEIDCGSEDTAMESLARLAARFGRREEVPGEAIRALVDMFDRAVDAGEWEEAAKVLDQLMELREVSTVLERVKRLPAEWEVKVKRKWRDQFGQLLKRWQRQPRQRRRKAAREARRLAEEVEPEVEVVEAAVPPRRPPPPRPPPGMDPETARRIRESASKWAAQLLMAYIGAVKPEGLLEVSETAKSIKLKVRRGKLEAVAESLPLTMWGPPVTEEQKDFIRVDISKESPWLARLANALMDLAMAWQSRGVPADTVVAMLQSRRELAAVLMHSSDPVQAVGYLDEELRVRLTPPTPPPPPPVAVDEERIRRLVREELEKAGLEEAARQLSEGTRGMISVGAARRYLERLEAVVGDPFHLNPLEYCLQKEDSRCYVELYTLIKDRRGLEPELAEAVEGCVGPRHEVDPRCLCRAVERHAPPYLRPYVRPQWCDRYL